MKGMMDPLIEGYLAYMRDVSRRVEGTQRDTRCTLKRVCEVMETIAPGVPIWKAGFRDFQRWLEIERGTDRSDTTIAKCLSHVRGFLDYAWRSGRAERNVLDGFSMKPAPQAPPSVLNINEAVAMIDACPSSTPLERRARLIVMLLYGCGLRTGELCALRVRDINVERSELIVNRGKGDKQRMVPIPGAVMREVTAYLLELGRRRGWMFVTQARGKGISQMEVGRIVREAAQRAGIERAIVPKTLRHSYATHLMDQGASLAVISVLMGHRGLHETGVYLHALGDKAHGAARALGSRLHKRGDWR